MDSDAALIASVNTNLVHYNFWTDVREHALTAIPHCPSKILSGCPPSKLDSNDLEHAREWVVPRSMSSPNLTLQEMNNWFHAISLIPESGSRPKRLTVGLVNDDGTVVYYFIHDGVVKPRKN